jgi:hypothetical protein
LISTSRTATRLHKTTPYLFMLFVLVAVAHRRRVSRFRRQLVTASAGGVKRCLSRVQSLFTPPTPPALCFFSYFLVIPSTRPISCLVLDMHG